MVGIQWSIRKISIPREHHDCWAQPVADSYIWRQTMVHSMTKIQWNIQFIVSIQYSRAFRRWYSGNCLNYSSLETGEAAIQSCLTRQLRHKLQLGDIWFRAPPSTTTHPRMNGTVSVLISFDSTKSININHHSYILLGWFCPTTKSTIPMKYLHSWGPYLRPLVVPLCIYYYNDSSMTNEWIRCVTCMCSIGLKVLY